MDGVYKKIRDIRIRKGMTQEELAEAVGYKSGRSMIAKIESGLVDLPMVKISAIASALGVDPSFLMGWDEPNEKFKGVDTDFIASIVTDQELYDTVHTISLLNKDNRGKVHDIASALLLAQET